MFSFLRGKQTGRSELKLWKVPLHVGRGTSTEMPANLAGAYVFVYVSAPDHEEAVTRAVGHLRGRGFEFLDLEGGQVLQLDPTKWDSYVYATWAAYRPHFPAQAEVISKMPGGFLFCGPFASYEVGAAQQNASLAVWAGRTKR